MKLHLPKALFTAVMALFAVGGITANAMTTTTTSREVTIDTSSTYDGGAFSYANGTITLNTSPSTFNATIDLDYDAFANVSTMKDLLYVNTTGSVWGFVAAGDGTIAGKWDTNDTPYTSNATIMSATDLAALATGTDGDTDRLISGLKVALQSGNPGTKMTTSDDTTVYLCSGLTQGSKTFNSVALDTTLISSITLTDSLAAYTFTNASGTWTKTYEGAGVVNATATKVQLNGGDAGSANTNTKPIVVGGSGYLHLEAWGQGTVNLDDDVYIGSSTHNVSAYQNAEHFGVIRISNDGNYGANLSGNIYLVEDSSIKGTGDQAINISGTLTDKAVPTGDADATVDGNYTLTLGGAGFELSGKVDLGGLNLVQGYTSNFSSFAGEMLISSSNAKVGTLTVGENTTLTVTGSLTLGSGVSNEGTLDWSNGTIVFENLDGDGYEFAPTEFYNKTTDGKTTSANGYAYTGKILLANGTITTTENTSISGDGLDTWEYVDGKGLIGTLADSTFDTTKFYVTSGTVKLSKTEASSDGIVYDDNSASTYVVQTGATLDVYFNTNNFNGDYALVGKTIQLKEGAKLTNTGGNGSTSWQMLNTVELLGNAKVEATAGNNYGFQASSGNESTLNLNGHELEKIGDGEFWLLNTTVSAGTIKITNGSLKVINKNSNASAADIVLNGSSAKLTVTADKALSVKSLSGTGTVDGAGTVTAGTLTLDGTMSLTDGKIAANAFTVSGGTLAMSGDAVLDLRGMYTNLSGGAGEGQPSLNVLLTSLKNGVTTGDTSYVLATGTTNANYTNDAGNINLRGNAELACHIVFTNNLGINGRAAWGQNPPFSITMKNGGSIKVGETGTGVLSLVTGTSLVMENGSSVEAGAVVLGHNAGQALSDTQTGNETRYYGKITMDGDDSKLKVDKITFNGSAANAVSVTDGVVEFTNTGNVTGSIISAADNDDKGTVSFNGTELVANNSWALASDSANVTMDLSGVTFNIAADKSVSLSGAHVQVDGANTVKGTGKLAFVGGLDNHLSDSASLAVKSGAKVTWNADSVSVEALNANTDATVSKAAINAASVSVNTATTTEVQAITGASEVSVEGGQKLTVSGASDMAKLTVNAGSSVDVSGNLVLSNTLAVAGENALSVTGGALTLSNGITINLTGLDIVDGKTSYTLATADNGVSLQNYTITGLDLTGTMYEGYRMTISPMDSNAAAGISLLAGEGNTNTNALVLTLEQNTTPLTQVTVTGAQGYDSASNVLTLTTNIADIDDYSGIASTLAATVTDSLWEQLVKDYGIGTLVNIALVDGAGNYFDLDGADNVGTGDDVALTINGIGVNAPAPTYSAVGNGAAVGPYVTSYIPEPTTGTLSILALAGLMIRRRRR